LPESRGGVESAAVDTGRAPEPARSERELLVEAVTLLTRNQTELEHRVQALEARLAGMSHDQDAEQRLVQLRGQVDRLSGRTQERGAEADLAAASHPASVVAASAPPPSATPPATLPAAAPQPAAPASPPPAAAVAAPKPNPSLEQRLASNITLDRAGLVFIGAGVVALLYAALTQIHP
jgi:hypothetical protein